MATNNCNNWASPVNIADGGLGSGSYTNTYGPLCAGATTTSPLLSISPGVSGSFLASAGSHGAPTFVNPALVFLQQLTASSSSSLAFTSTYITSTYSIYVFFLDNVLLTYSASGNFHIRISINNGSAQITSGYTGGYNAFAYNSATLSNISGGGYAQLNNVGASGTVLMNGYLYMMINNDNWYMVGQTTQGSNIAMNYSSNITPAGVVNWISFIGSSATLTSGTITCYGIKS